MTANEIRFKFLDFFESKMHKIVPSAPIIVKDDPTLMFTNAGMNQFKDIFLGNKKIEFPRIADSQKCLRVSGKHNDLEEVGYDTYHHTMFEMLGNWSFGDYFKKEAIEWAWEFLVDVCGIDKNIIYTTYFEGDASENLDVDSEAKNLWLKYLPEERVLKGNKKDNFWEMGAQGPCGPCSEIHVDLRTGEEKAKVHGSLLVNNDNPQVIEIWNLVFIQYNRKADGSLESLPNKHVDTGMGFERLCRVIQRKTSNYDSDVFQNIIKSIEQLTGKKYGAGDDKVDVSMRVVADHIRTIAFAIADGQLPSNNKAGYVIRRILRRAVRYIYTFLDVKEPLLVKLIPTLINEMGHCYPELIAQQNLIEKVTEEEEKSFLRTLEHGIKLLNDLVEDARSKNKSEISGKDVFVLFDTFGFPLDLTELILREHALKVNLKEYESEMAQQKERSRGASNQETEDWVDLLKDINETFVGYDVLETEIKIAKYRKIQVKQKTSYQLIFDKTPFYAESGGQMGDNGFIDNESEKIYITDTKKENGVSIHYAEKLPSNVTSTFKAVVNVESRTLTSNNHSATHLLQKALQKVLGTHVEQKGSLVNKDCFRFDFSHFQKMTDEEIEKVEAIVNSYIRKNAVLQENRKMPITEAKQQGAMAIFGEKYGEYVRAVRFDDSFELCGGTHVASTGQIGFFKIISESAISAGVRRIEGITAIEAEKYIQNSLKTLKEVSHELNNPKDLLGQLRLLKNEKAQLEKQIEGFENLQVAAIKKDVLVKKTIVGDIQVIITDVDVNSAKSFKNLSFQLKDESIKQFVVITATIDGKPNVSVIISESLVKEKGLHAGKIVSELAKEIDGGGGGQPTFASAGGKNPNGISKILEKAKIMC